MNVYALAERVRSEYVNLFCERKTVKTVTARNGEVERAQHVTRSGVRLLLPAKHAVYVHSNVPEKVPDVEPVKVEGMRPPEPHGNKGKHVVGVVDPLDGDLAAEISEMRKKAKNVVVHFRSTVRETLYVDALGAEVYQRISRNHAIVMVQSGDGKYTVHAREWSFTDNPLEWFTEDRILELEKKAEEIARAPRPPEGTHTVVLDGEMTGLLVHEALGHALEADAVARGFSCVKRGDTVGSELVTIVDDPTENWFGHYAFDDEGVKAKRRVLVEKGVVTDYLSDLMHAEIVGSRPGNGRSESYRAPPIPRMSNTFLLPGDTGWDELTESADYVVRGFAGGTVSPADGVFQFSALWIEDKKGNVFKGTTLSGQVTDTLKSVSAVGKDVDSSPGMCGKEGQSVPVDGPSPPVIVRVRLGG